METTKSFIFLLVLVGILEFHAHVMRLNERIGRLHRFQYYYMMT